jgi:hypothetical protein
MSGQRPFSLGGGNGSKCPVALEGDHCAARCRVVPGTPSLSAVTRPRRLPSRYAAVYTQNKLTGRLVIAHRDI